MGLARPIEELRDLVRMTSADQILGTPDYMAPEQARKSRDADIRADIFGLGCTLFHLMTGELPFGGKTIMQKYVAHASEDPKPARSVRPEVLPKLEQIMLKMLAREREDRFQIPQEVAEELAPFSML